MCAFLGPDISGHFGAFQPFSSFLTISGHFWLFCDFCQKPLQELGKNPFWSFLVILAVLANFGSFLVVLGRSGSFLVFLALSGRSGTFLAISGHFGLFRHF